MKIKLLAPKDYNETEGKQIINYMFSFDMRRYTKNLWSNGWCPCTRMKITPQGELIARISSELVPVEYYQNIVVEVSDHSRFGQSIEYYLKKGGEA